MTSYGRYTISRRRVIDHPGSPFFQFCAKGARLSHDFVCLCVYCWCITVEISGHFQQLLEQMFGLEGKEKTPQSRGFQCFCLVEMRGIEPLTS